ncbi:hypothetical protein [Maribacter thermophilus]|uniref:hypothetical protein n=1 Tax=Maribacter thermophilus TaxID=1197874 RepID=UPI000699D1F0|nr:hypothetical protein [Maribacter thermophilus]
METKDIMEKHMEKKAKKFIKKVLKIIMYIILGIAIAFLVGYIVMLLWNWLMPYLFGLPQVDYWKALGILILAKIIFGFGGSGDKSHDKKVKSKKKRFFGSNCKDWKNDFSDWKHYDEFWKEEGEQAYKNYLERNKK